MKINGALLQVCAIVLCSVSILSRSATPAGASDMLVVRNAVVPGLADVHYTEQELKTLPQVTIRTRTEFTDGVVTFVGPLVRDLIAPIDKGKGTTLHLTAVNDYAVDIPIRDVTKYDVILAMSANGKRLSVRDKGPLWLMYPMDDFPELQDASYNAKLIWQLSTAEIR